MPNTAQFKYKCRKCGAEYYEGTTSRITARDILVNVVYGFKSNLKIGLAPEFKSIHSCNTGQGVSDLIGYDVE